MKSTPDVLSRKFILVVDDDQAILELLADGLASFGYLARTANSSNEALEIVTPGISFTNATDLRASE